MTPLLQLFSNNLLPILLTASAGYIFGKLLEVDARTVSRVVFYVFSPCLVFKLLTANQLAGDDVFRIVAFAFVSSSLVGLVAYLLGRAFKLERRMLLAVVLTSTLLNAGNYGLSLNSFAFGETALAYASIFFIASATITYTVGVVIASMGSVSFKDALLGLRKIPTVYALIFALPFNAFHITLPTFADRAVTLLSDAAIPGMLVLLGLQFQRSTWTDKLRALGLANAVRLLVGPAIAIGLSLLFNLRGPAQQAAVTEASMPTAVMSTALATEFDLEPGFVTTVVTTTTLLSPLVLTPLLAYLGA